MSQFNKKRDTPAPSQFDLRPHFEAVTMLWKGKKKEEEKGFLKTLKGRWNGEEEKHGFEFPFLKKTNEEKSSWFQKAMSGIVSEEPVGVAGVGCGIGLMVGFGITGSHFVGPRFSPFDDDLKLAFGYGTGCGIGIAYGHGFGLGYLADLADKPERRVFQTR